MITKEQKNKWKIFHDNFGKDFPKWPNETLIKIFFGKYLKNKINVRQGEKLLDIGCGFGQNFRPFIDKNLKCYGVEVDSNICEMVNRYYSNQGEDVEVKVGDNQNLPYKDDYFEYIISINAIHYESNEEGINSALTETNRVLKPGGRFIVFTVGPEHLIYKRAKSLGNHKYEIDDFDFRDGQQLFYFDNLKYLEFYLQHHFKDIELGRVTENLMERPLDFLIAVCTK